jgi:hypothetical protein
MRSDYSEVPFSRVDVEATLVNARLQGWFDNEEWTVAEFIHYMNMGDGGNYGYNTPEERQNFFMECMKDFIVLKEGP